MYFIYGDFMKVIKDIVVIDGQINRNLVYYKFNTSNNTYTVKYKNSNKFYSYSYSRVMILRNGVEIKIDSNIIFYNGLRLKNIKNIFQYIYDNTKYYVVNYNNNTQSLFKERELIIYNNANNNILDYLSEVSKIISLETDNGKKILSDQMSKVQLDNLESSLANYLRCNENTKKNDNLNCLIFPFGCNSSQYLAVENAMNNKTSIIEGPPGTGKTQTILNIIANIIIRDMNCQVVSNNNAAIENIEEKLKKYNLDFIVALLGKNNNKKIFIECQNNKIPSLDEYKDFNLNELSIKINEYYKTVKSLYTTKNQVAILKHQLNELELEYKYFKVYLKNQNIKILNLKVNNKSKLSYLLREIESINKLTFLNKLKFMCLYRIGSISFYKNEMNLIINTLKNELYKYELDNLRTSISEKENFIKNYNIYEKEYIRLSMQYLKSYLFNKYCKNRKIYTLSEIRRNSYDFVKDYPVILSTTYSSRNTFSYEFKFDYIIMDEASQIDVVTGALALSSATYSVVIGDEKQLPNVISDKVKMQTDLIFKNYSLDIGYSFSLNSFLNSIKKIVSTAPITLLKEHYRCHPKIINFCSKKFYNNQLVIMTEDKGEKNVIRIIKTNKGNHSRDNSNQRQLDIIKDIVKELGDNSDIGIIAPYNNQVSLIKNSIPNVEVSTVHKFQGREKNTIIISTVDDEITDFVANANILNVAISRAKNNLIFIVTGNTIKNKNITDFIDYAEYNNMEIEDSKIYSVFDLLYKQHELERLNFFKKHNRISKYDSENLIYYLIDETVKKYDNLGFIFHQPMRSLIKDKSLLNEKEIKYVLNNATHIDFIIYNLLSKKPILAIEVDGYKFHKEGSEQYNRDLMKNDILKKYNIPLVRLKTNGSREKEIICDELNRIYNIK